MSKPRLYIEEYHCGCSAGPLRRSELPGYCGHHGEDRRGLYPLPTDQEVAALKRCNDPEAQLKRDISSMEDSEDD